MVTKILTLLGLFLLYSCISYTKLKDGTTVPSKNYQFKNTKKFEIDAFEKININYLYYLKESYFIDKNNKKIRDFAVPTIRYLQFYVSGQVRNLYYFNPNPEDTGRRGIIYKSNGKLKLDITQTNQGGGIYLLTFDVNVEGDLLYLYENKFSLFSNNERVCYIYKKSEKIPEEWKRYKADW